MKEIADLCGIEKQLTFHLARHTFANLTFSKGVSIESVSKMLGHSNIKTTQIYARITDAKIGNDMAMFAGKLNEEKSKSATKPAINPKSSINNGFENLRLDEKLDLLNIQYDMRTLAANATELEKQAFDIWDKLSDKAKQFFWDEVFGNKQSRAIQRLCTSGKLIRLAIGNENELIRKVFQAKK